MKVTRYCVCAMYASAAYVIAATMAICGNNTIAIMCIFIGIAFTKFGSLYDIQI